MFKNAIFYTLTDSLTATAETLSEKLLEQAFTLCKSQQLSSYGWTTPCCHRDQLAIEAMGGIMISTKKEEKILPSSVIKEELAEKVSVIESEQARKVYKKERDQIRDEVILDLLPRAFSKYSITTAIIIPATGWIVVDAPNYKRAEELLSHLRGTLGSLPIALPDVQKSPSAVMSSWLELSEFPPLFEMLDSCVLRDNVLEGGIIRITGQQLQDEEYIAHLEAGKRVVKLALEWDGSLKFALTDDLSIKSLSMTDQRKDKRADEAAEDEVAQFDADLAMMTLEFNKLLPSIINAFGGEAIREAA